MRFEEYLKAIIKDEAQKLILRYHAYHNAMQIEHLRNVKRISNAAPKKILVPDYWGKDLKFNPFYVRRKSAAIAHAITKKIANRTYQPLPPHVKEIPKSGGGIRPVAIYQIPDAAVSRIESNCSSRRNRCREFVCPFPSL